MEIRKAQRKQAKIKLALQGPSGSGKTIYTCCWKAHKIFPNRKSL